MFDIENVVTLPSVIFLIVRLVQEMKRHNRASHKCRTRTGDANKKIEDSPRRFANEQLRRVLGFNWKGTYCKMRAQTQIFDLHSALIRYCDN